MKSLKTIGYAAIATLLSLTIFLSSCTKEDDTTSTTTSDELTGDFVLEFENLYDTDPLNLETEYYTGTSDTLSFSTVRYYISNIQLTKLDGTIWSEENSYHLLDHKVPSSQLVSIKNVPAGEYYKVNYLIGVDSAKNVSGAQEGDLSPANDMFWSWSTGYIFFKLEGTSTQAADGNFAYHIGGFSGQYNALIEKTHGMYDHMLNINPDATPQVHITVNLKEFFDGHHGISTSEVNKVHMPGAMAKELAHSFGEAFSLDHIHD